MNPLELLDQHTFRVMLVGTVLLGMLTSSLGALTYLRRQALLNDVVATGSLLGVVVAFAVGTGWLGIDGRASACLATGAFLVGLAALWLITMIARHTPVSTDVAMAVVLSLFLGGGLLALRIVSTSSLRGRAGLQEYLFGNAATLTYEDVVTTAVVGVIAWALVWGHWQGLAAHLFDPVAAHVWGYHPRRADLVIAVATIASLVVGIKTVGVILVVAFGVAPPVAARQWTSSLRPFIALSGFIGAMSAAVGCWLSVLLGSVPTGPVLVLVMSAICAVSLLVAPQRGVLARAVSRQRRRRALLKDMGMPS